MNSRWRFSAPSRDKVEGKNLVSLKSQGLKTTSAEITIPNLMCKEMEFSVPGSRGVRNFLPPNRR